jgi:DNA (cytosine-5)-methyltransferase 1
MGYSRAGFDVVGVDLVNQPHYPFEFHENDAMSVLWWGCVLVGIPELQLDSFAAIHASPPCQAYSTATRDRSRHPDLIGLTRHLLEATGLPWVMENVPNAPMRWGVTLCGGMFGLEIRRHRTFEMSSMVLQPHHECPVQPWEVTGHAGGGNRKSQSHRKYRDLAHAKQLMEMPWAQTCREVTEAIPPAYTEWIGASLLQAVNQSVHP